MLFLLRPVRAAALGRRWEGKRSLLATSQPITGQGLLQLVLLAHLLLQQVESSVVNTTTTISTSTTQLRNTSTTATETTTSSTSMTNTTTSTTITSSTFTTTSSTTRTHTSTTISSTTSSTTTSTTTPFPTVITGSLWLSVSPGEAFFKDPNVKPMIPDAVSSCAGVPMDMVTVLKFEPVTAGRRLTSNRHLSVWSFASVKEALWQQMQSVMPRRLQSATFVDYTVQYRIDIQADEMAKRGVNSTHVVIVLAHMDRIAISFKFDYTLASRVGQGMYAIRVRGHDGPFVNTLGPSGKPARATTTTPSVPVVTSGTSGQRQRWISAVSSLAVTWFSSILSCSC
eukprot:TRINITY_DN67645_c0_g1_i1.p1 TRINITY_DN67645_c0_g1~~TRINITY_DN67645_c0_g1_i1.p1  ORF type:complete len:341 (+),score=29.46 TRINITY_DN67645_c0_g1_i1:112-1134(+)